jgi:hypothetical protein
MPRRALPSATETFHLRSECVRLAQKIIDDDLHGPAVSVDGLSHYNPETNRCYVELDSTTYDARKPNFGRPNDVTEYRRSLYDAQTNDLLAFLVDHPRDSEPHSVGMVFVDHERADDTSVQLPANASQDDGVKRMSEAAYNDTSTFIDKAMEDDRKR